MSNRSATVLLDTVLPQATLAQNALLVVGGSLLVALCAQVSVPLPFSPVPVTGQTFAVLLLGATLGARRGAAALLLYLAEGAAGLPVFAPGGLPGVARLAGAAGRRPPPLPPPPSPPPARPPPPASPSSPPAACRAWRGWRGRRAATCWRFPRRRSSSAGWRKSCRGAGGRGSARRSPPRRGFSPPGRRGRGRRPRR